MNHGPDVESNGDGINMQWCSCKSLRVNIYSKYNVFVDKVICQETDVVRYLMLINLTLGEPNK